MKTAIVFLADGFEECEGLLVVDLLRRAGVEVVTASIMGRKEITSSHGITLQADALAEDVDFDAADMIVLPGGLPGTNYLGESEIVREQCVSFVDGGSAEKKNAASAVRYAADIYGGAEQVHQGETEEEYAEAKYVAAICAAPSVLADLGLLDGKRATCHTNFEDKMAGAVVTRQSVTVDGNIITGQGLGAGIPFALKLVEMLVDKETADGIAKAICC